MILFLSAGVLVAPMLVHGPACGIDFPLHYANWQNALTSWRHGIPYPHWTASPNFDAGEPRFVFYPPFTWMLGAALGIVLPWVLVPIALNFLLVAGCGFATRALARQVLPEWPAQLAACTAIFSGYEFYEIYRHSDFALLSGGLWMPLLLLFWLRRRPEPDFRWHLLWEKDMLILAVILALTWLSNTPLGLMATYMLIALALLSAVQHRSWAPLVRVAIVIGLGSGLAAFYLVPADVEQHWVDILKLFAAPDHLIQNRWITSELARPRPHASASSQRLRGVVEVCMLTMAVGGLLLRWWRIGRAAAKAASQRTSQEYWLAFGFIACAVLFLMFPISLPIWNLLPRLRYLQYPWRWLLVLQAPMAILFVAAIWPTRVRWKVCVTTAGMLLFLGATYAVTASPSFYKQCPADSSDPTSIAGINRALQPGGIGVGGSDEYTSPPGARNELIATDLPDACLVSDPMLTLSDVPATGVVSFYKPRAWSPELGTCEATFSFTSNPGAPEHLRLNAQISHPGFLVLRLRSYPAWRVSVNGTAVRTLPVRDDGLMAVPVTSGPVFLKVDWTTTPDVLLGRSISALSLAVIILLGVWSKCHIDRSSSETRPRAPAPSLLFENKWREKRIIGQG